MKIVLVSYTPLDAPGGVPRWNNDFISAFPDMQVVHYSWTDVMKEIGRDVPLAEWEKAWYLSIFLRQKRLVTESDIVVGDGFWADGYWPKRTISVSHGNWSHTTLSDVEKGIPPEFPDLHQAQLNFRKAFSFKGGTLVAVSHFIAHQCRIQWGLESSVINNGIDLDRFKPPSQKLNRHKPLIIHGVTNSNKGFDHINILKKNLVDADVMLLDEAVERFGLSKSQTLGQADAVVIPSAHEGNSYFCLESLACGVPIVCYDVGLNFEISTYRYHKTIGEILSRENRSPELTLEGVKRLLKRRQNPSDVLEPRLWAERYSIERFRTEWSMFIRSNFKCL